MEQIETETFLIYLKEENPKENFFISKTLINN